jgi:predicted RND superfamily exporter protein
LKENNNVFASLVREDLGTTAPGLAGSFLFASLTLLAEVKGSLKSLSSDTYREWSSFVDHVNTHAPESISPVVAQSGTFLNAHRAEETISSTGLSWLISNLVCLLIILGFTRSLCLSAMVTVVLVLIFLCLAGVLFGIFKLPFGPVEALGVSIFVGLSANYSLHVVHAYQHSSDNNREGRVKSALFATGSPIIASALSTIGGCIFLFGCRTYVFIELGLLICSITMFALIFSMTFLPAWLTMMGPLPRESIEDAQEETVMTAQR